VIELFIFQEGFMKKIVVLFLCASSIAYASDFSARVAEGNRLSATSPGKKYESSLGTSIRTAIQFCIPPGSVAPENRGPFAMVAYVSKSGALSAVEVQPKTKNPECFAQKLAQGSLPIPPEEGATKLGYPITIEMMVR
jgi:hypothetical protein